MDALEVKRETSFTSSARASSKRWKISLLLSLRLLMQGCDYWKKTFQISKQGMHIFIPRFITVVLDCKTSCIWLHRSSQKHLSSALQDLFQGVHKQSVQGMKKLQYCNVDPFIQRGITRCIHLLIDGYGYILVYKYMMRCGQNHQHTCGPSMWAGFMIAALLRAGLFTSLSHQRTACYKLQLNAKPLSGTTSNSMYSNDLTASRYELHYQKALFTIQFLHSIEVRNWDALQGCKVE